MCSFVEHCRKFFLKKNSINTRTISLCIYLLECLVLFIVVYDELIHSMVELKLVIFLVIEVCVGVYMFQYFPIEINGSSAS